MTTSNSPLRRLPRRNDGRRPILRPIFYDHGGVIGSTLILTQDGWQQIGRLHREKIKENKDHFVKVWTGDDWDDDDNDKPKGRWADVVICKSGINLDLSKHLVKVVFSNQSTIVCSKLQHFLVQGGIVGGEIGRRRKRVLAQDLTPDMRIVRYVDPTSPLPPVLPEQLVEEEEEEEDVDPYSCTYILFGCRSALCNGILVAF